MSRFAIICSGIFLSCILTVQAAVYTVTNTNDSGAGSLRWAITQANNNPGPDNINFNIGGGGGVQTINLLTPLPIINDLSGGVTIDGYTQPGAFPGSNPPATAVLLIVLNGAGIMPQVPPPVYSHGLHIMSANNTIRGLVIQNFPHDGICVEGVPTGANNNLIYGNYVGTDASGQLAAQNGWHNGFAGSLWAGIQLVCRPTSNGVVQNNAVDHNLVSGNYAEGIGISSCPPNDVSFNNVTFNYVGVDRNGIQPVSNIHCGIYIGEAAHDNLVDHNISCANGYDGVAIVGFAERGWYTNNNVVSNNHIGVDVNLSPLGNFGQGVSLGAYGLQNWEGYVEYNVVCDNVIAYNQYCGVMVWEHPNNTANADFNSISRNAIHHNGYLDPGYLGIDLQFDQVTPNDPGDPDMGANAFVNFPVITSATYNQGFTQVNGIVNLDTNPAQAQVEVFRAIPGADGSGYGQGAVYLGVAVPDAGGNWTLQVTGVYPQDLLTATTTDVNLNTSEFSQNFVIPGEQPQWDYGDAPDPTYPTLLANGGARHYTGTAWYLGNPPDSENDGQPSVLADGDDLNGLLDEDGVVFGPVFIPGHYTSFQVFASTSGFLDGWLDFAVDGSWAQTGDQFLVSRPLVGGLNTITLQVPGTSPYNTDTYMRLRFSSTGGLNFTGTHYDGEVEDWLIHFEENMGIDYGDAPDPT